MCRRDDLKAEGLADGGNGTYGFADGLASGDGSVSVSDKEHTDERRQDGEWATVPRKRTQTNGERNGGHGCVPFGRAGLEAFIHRVRVVETMYATQRE
jgi:hypothetical protein